MTQENYHSTENNMLYMSHTQFVMFDQCPAMAMASLRGEYQFESTALLMGQALDAHFDGTWEAFQKMHPEMFRRDGSLRNEFVKVSEAVKVIERDPVMLRLCSGEQQVIMTGEIEGIPVKIMIDSLLPGRIIDRKYMKDFKDIYKDGERMPWWQARGYDIQAAMYTEIYRQNTGEILPFELVAVSKENVPDKAWIRFSRERLDRVMDSIKWKIPTFDAMKKGIIEADACGECEFCRSKKMLREPEEV